MNINDVIKYHLDNADKKIDEVANRLNSGLGLEAADEVGELVNSINEVIAGLRKLNDQMRPLASLSALLLSAEKLQGFARGAAAAELEADQAKPFEEPRFISIDGFPKGGD